MKARAYKFIWVVLGVVVLCALLPFDERTEAVDLSSVYRKGLTSAKQLHSGERSLWLEHNQLAFHIQASAYMDMSRATAHPLSSYGAHNVATSHLGDSGRVTRQDEVLENFDRGNLTGHPCQLFFRRKNMIAYVEFEKPDQGIHWPEEVNRLSDAEQIALLEEVGRVLDQALIAKAPGVQVIKWSFADTCRVKLQALWDNIILRIIGGGPYHYGKGD